MNTQDVLTAKYGLTMSAQDVADTLRIDRNSIYLKIKDRSLGIPFTPKPYRASTVNVANFLDKKA